MIQSCELSCTVTNFLPLAEGHSPRGVKCSAVYGTAGKSRVVPLVSKVEPASPLPVWFTPAMWFITTSA